MSKLLLLAPLMFASAIAATTTQAADLPSARNFIGVWWIDNYDPALLPSNGEALPFTPAGQTKYKSNVEQMQAGKSVDAASKNCLPEGLPRSMASPYPLEIVQDDQHVTVIHEANHAFWSIALNGKHPGEDELDASFMGHSIGHWEGDTLVVDSVGFKPRSWIDTSGVSVSTSLHVVQRIRKLNGGKQLDVVMTIDDPLTFTKPWSVRRTYEARPDVTLMEFTCGEPHRVLTGQRAKAYYYLSGAMAKGVPQDAAMAGFPKPVAAPDVNRTTLPNTANKNSNLAKVPDFSGVWRHARGVKGDKADMFPPGKPADYSFLWPWAEAEVKRHRDSSKAGYQIPIGNMNCLPDGVPYLMGEAHSSQVLQTKDKLIFFFEADHQIRHVFMSAEHPANLMPSWYGHSIGHWEGDTLVIDTVGLNDKSQVDGSGMPHSEALHVVERMRFSDGNKQFELKTTVEDPIILKNPWTYSLFFTRDSKDTALSNEYACAENLRN